MARRMVAIACLVVSWACATPVRAESETPRDREVGSGRADAAASHPRADATLPRQFFLLDTAEVHLAPSGDALATNTLYRQQAVEVFEFRDGWARVSEFYDGTVEGTHGHVARWVRVEKLGTERPKDLKQPTIIDDPRVQYIPKIGDAGLTKRDVEVLHAAARYFLEIGAGKLVEYGDKSTREEGLYYVNFGGPQNRFFRPDDIPDLEERISSLYQ
jgi:hypothetical protein